MSNNFDIKGLDSLDINERKKLFNKFIEAGGKVVDNKKKNLLNFDRERQKNLIKKIEARKKHNKTERKHQSTSNIYNKQKTAVRKNSAFDRLKIYFKGITNGVTTLSGKYISKKLFKFIKYELVPNLDKLDISLNYILASNEETIQKIISILDNMGEYYTDVFENFIQFYNEREFNGILYFYNNEKYPKVPIKLIEEPFKKIFKKLYILKNHLLYIYPAVKTAISTIARQRNWDRKILANRLWIARTTINIISNKLLKKFHILALLYLKENLPLNSKRISTYLNITKEDKIGYHKIEELFSQNKKEISEYFTTETAQEDENSIKKYFSDLSLEEIEKLDLDENVKQGFKSIKEIDRENIKEYEIKNNGLANLPEKDKIRELFILLKEFEREYSFILTSHRIVIKPIFENNKRVDYKDKLNALYSRLNTVYELITEYTEVSKSLDDVENDEALNPINKFNRITAIEGKRSKLSFEIRKAAKKYIGEVYALFTKIITDYNTKKLIVENPEDEIRFNTDIEGKKKVDGMKIIEAIKIAANYLSGVLYRLEDFGDFSGIKTELKENNWYVKEEISGTADETTEKPAAPENDNFFDELEEYIYNKNRTADETS